MGRALKIFISLIACYSSIGATNVSIINDPQKVLHIKKASVFKDTSNNLIISDISSDADFKKTNTVLNLGVSPYNHWIKFQVKNNTNQEKFLLEIDNPLIYEAEIYHLDSVNNPVAMKITSNTPLSNRAYFHQNFLFDISIPKNNTKTFLLKVNSGEQLIVPISIGSPQSIFKAHNSKDILFSLYAGVILVMFLYNLFIYFSVKDKNYLIYISYILFVGLTQLSIQGYTLRYFWPDSPWIEKQSLIIFAAFAGIAIILFIKSFLNTKKYSPLGGKFFNILIFICIIEIILRLNHQYEISYQLTDLNAAVVSLSGLFIAIRISLKGYRPAKFFLIAWAIFLVGIIIYVLRNFGILPYNNFTNYVMPLGNAIEVILLSLALADRINILREEKEIQHKALLEHRYKQVILKNRTLDLEQKVKTQDSTLQQVQFRLVQNEKMASVGQIAAGVAHEINNPINFISASLFPLKRDIQDIITLIHKYEQLSDNENINEKIKEIKAIKKELDIEYLLEEINHMLSSIEEGTSRTTEIVKSLRTFSHEDDSTLKKTDIMEGIESTLTMLKSKLGTIKIIKNYSHEAEIECYPSKLNQVFMNLLSNAADAIISVKNRSLSEGIITIQTEVINNQLYIQIKDNGVGIPKEIQEKIFDTFFTTKDIGKGTGLGLSISYGIIEAHKGKLEVTSEEGEGTEFTIILPMQ